MPLPLPVAERLACPICKELMGAPLDGQRLCRNGHAFQERNGVPLLRRGATLESISPQGGEGVADVRDILGLRGLKKSIKDLVGTNYVPQPFPYRDHFAPNALTLNIGSGMTPKLSSATVNLDYFLFPTVDVVADAASIPFMDETFDAVISEFTIEHVEDPFAVCAEISRVLRPGGRLYLSYPFIHPYHSFPMDFFRFTPMGLERMLPGLTALAKGPLTGPSCRWIGSTVDLLTFWIPWPRMRFSLRALALALLFPIKYLDIFLNKLPAAMDHAVTLFGLFEKSATTPSGRTHGGCQTTQQGNNTANAAGPGHIA